MTHKPFSQACENNKDPILQIISTVFCHPTTVWEIGSGTGQHACYFARHLPHLEWQPTDRAENIPGIGLWQKEAQLNTAGGTKPPRNNPLRASMTNHWASALVHKSAKFGI